MLLRLEDVGVGWGLSVEVLVSRLGFLASLFEIPGLAPGMFITFLGGPDIPLEAL